MSPDSQSASGTVLIAHRDPHFLDHLTVRLEQSGLRVRVAATAFAAQGALDAMVEEPVVVAFWDGEKSLAGRLLKWALKHRESLCSRMLFVYDKGADQFFGLDGDNIPSLHTSAFDDICSAVVQLANPAEISGSSSLAQAARLASQPSLLLVEDEEIQRRMIGDFFREEGYKVSAVSSLSEAIDLLKEHEFSAIISDWFLGESTGADLFEWLEMKAPEMIQRLLYLSGSFPEGIEKQAPGVVFLPKGQDAKTMLFRLNALISRS